jgi:hypothetical protein
MRPSPSAPIVIDVPVPTEHGMSIVYVVAVEHEAFEQCATLRLAFVPSE